MAPKIAHPAVVRFAESALALGVLDDRPQKERRIKHLGLDAELVHVREARLDAEHFAGFLGGVGADVTVFAVGAPLDHPEVAYGGAFVAAKLRAEALCHQLRRKAPLVVVEITPSLHRLDHVRVSVDRSHRFPPR